MSDIPAEGNGQHGLEGNGFNVSISLDKIQLAACLPLVRPQPINSRGQPHSASSMIAARSAAGQRRQGNEHAAFQ
jgi:hypothetical protein